MDCDIKSLKVAGKGGLVLIMHASEMADGNALAEGDRQAGHRASSAPVDMVGMLYYDFNAQAGTSRSRTIGDEPRLDCCARSTACSPATCRTSTRPCRLAYDDADRPEARPGDQAHHHHQRRRPAAERTSSILHADEGRQDHLHDRRRGDARRAEDHEDDAASPRRPAARLTTTSPTRRPCPPIYIKETRLVSQSFVYEKRFQPRLQSASGPDRQAAGTLPPLHGFVRTTLKQSPLVEMPHRGAADAATSDFPILASLAVRPGQGGGVHLATPAPRRRRGSAGTATGPARTCTRSSGSRSIDWALRGGRDAAS